MQEPGTTTRPATHPTACRTCRRRGRKCDKSLPSCQSCKDRSVVCEGYVTRWTGVAARGKLRGKTVPILVDEECTGGGGGQGKCLVKKRKSPVSTTATTPKGQTSSSSPPLPRKLPLQPQQQRPSQEVSRISRSSSIERILPGTSDDLDTFIDYCEFQLTETAAHLHDEGYISPGSRDLSISQSADSFAGANQLPTTSAGSPT